MRGGREEKGGAGRNKKEGSENGSVRVIFRYVPAHTQSMRSCPPEGRESTIYVIYIYI